MSAQTSYGLSQANALAGLLYSTEKGDRITRAAEGAADIPFGYAVSRGTNADTQAVAGGTSFLGITIRSLDQEGSAQTGDLAYRPTQAMAVMRAGYIWVAVAAGCVPGDVAKYVTATGAIDSGAPVVGEAAIPGGTFETTATAGTLALLRIA